MRKIIFAATLACAVFIGHMAEAQTRNGSIRHTQAQQRQRIKQGIRNGSITKGEARHLHMQQVKIRHYQQMAKADGRISPAERRMICSQQQYAGRNIYAQKHDRQNRYGYYRYKR